MAPVPRVEVRFDELEVIDGGSPADVGSPVLDGGTPSATGAVLDGGSAAMVSVEVPEGTEQVTVWRRSQGRSFKVRGAVSRPILGLGGVLDHEAGLNVASSYELECFAGGQLVGRVSLGAVTLPWVGDPNAVLVQQPLNPNLNATVVNLEDSWRTLTREAPGRSVAVEGRGFPRVVASGPRGGVTGVDLDFGAPSRGHAEAVWATLGDEENPQLPVWLVRSPGGFLPSVFFAQVGALAEEDLDVRNGGGWSRFRAVVDEVAPPAPGLVVASLTYDDLAAVFPTYEEMAEALPRYSDWSSAWQYAGAAGGGGA